VTARIEAKAFSSEAGPGSRSRKRSKFLPTLFRTTAFKLTAIYLLIFALFAGFVLGYVAWNAQRLLNDQIRSTIEAASAASSIPSSAARAARAPRSTW
jgi:hypothetical protein